MSTTNILIVEDNAELRQLIAQQVRNRGYEVTESGNGSEGLSLALSGQFTLVILDINLPGKSGYEICQTLREERPELAIIILSSKSEEVEIIAGLELGADDYVTKPFRVGELLARIESALRRLKVVTGEQMQRFVRHELELDGLSRKVFLTGVEIELTKREFDLLYLLASNPGRAFTRADIVNEVWQSNVSGYERAVNSVVLRLRGKIEADVTQPMYIKSVRGVGYRFASEEELESA